MRYQQLGMNFDFETPSVDCITVLNLLLHHHKKTLLKARSNKDSVDCITVLKLLLHHHKKTLLKARSNKDRPSILCIYTAFSQFLFSTLNTDLMT